MKIIEFRKLIREEVRKIVNEFGPTYGSQNYSRTSSSPLVKEIGKLDSILMDTSNLKANMEWEDMSSEILNQNDAKYWADLDDQELKNAIDAAQSIIKKYNIK